MVSRARHLPVIVALLLAFLSLCAARATAAADTSSLEFAVKAAYLYKLGEFVGWPGASFPKPDSPLNLCIAGADPFGSTLDKVVDGHRIGDRAIAIRRVQTVEPDSDCQILYVGTEEARKATHWLEAARQAHMLTVTDSAPADSGGIVNFIVRDGHVRFEINNQSAVASGLVISSKLLALAQPKAKEGGE